jgi:hypothetical protein
VNWKASGENDPAATSLAHPDLQTRTEPELGNPEGDWLCAWCLNGVANERDRFQYNDQDEFTFTNPERIRFEIVIFSETRGCRQTGQPTLEHTWFPGHAWSYCQCGECGQHLGWYYTGQDQFVGLIKERIVRALCLRN